MAPQHSPVFYILKVENIKNSIIDSTYNRPSDYHSQLQGMIANVQGPEITAASDFEARRLQEWET